MWFRHFFWDNMNFHAFSKKKKKKLIDFNRKK